MPLNTNRISIVLSLMQILGLVLVVASTISSVNRGVLILIGFSGLAGFLKPIICRAQRDALTIVTSVAGLGVIVLTTLKFIR